MSFFRRIMGCSHRITFKELQNERKRRQKRSPKEDSDHKLMGFGFYSKHLSEELLAHRFCWWGYPSQVFANFNRISCHHMSKILHSSETSRAARGCVTRGATCSLTIPVRSCFTTADRSRQYQARISQRPPSSVSKSGSRFQRSYRPNLYSLQIRSPRYHYRFVLDPVTMPFACFPSRSPKASKTATQVVFVLGGPGSGKGTQCARIVTEFGYVHLSAGDLLRAERAKKDSKNGQLIENCIKEGTLVPVEVVMALLKEAIESNTKASGAHKFLIDGFPRNKDNLDGWEKHMKGVQTEFVLFLDCDEKVMEERLITRGQTSGRADDNIETIKKRFTTFQESTKPIVEHFDKIGKLRRVSANNSVDEVFAEITKLFKPSSDAKGESANPHPAKADSAPTQNEPAKVEPQADSPKLAQTTAN